MPTYFLDSSSPGILNTLSYSSSSLVISIPALNTASYEWGTPIFYPNTTVAPSGTATLTLTHSVTNMNVDVQAALTRTGGVFGTTSTPVVTAATNTITLDYPSWVGATCSDQLYVLIDYVNNSMSTQSVTLSLNNVNTRLLTTLEHNGPGCQVLRKPSWVITT